MFIFMQKNLSFTSFLEYYKDIPNLLFWVLWAFLAMPNNSNVYLQTKNQIDPSICFTDITLSRILQCDGLRKMWAINPDQEFS